MATKKQHGFINLNLAPLLLFAVIGIIALLVGIPSLLYWLFTNFTIVAL